MATEDPYRVLGLTEDATPDEIRSAFRRLARQYHPDVGAGTSDQMAALNRAYALLSDPARRRGYDASRRAPAAPPRAHPRARPASAPDDARPWEADLDSHADDWRQMYREERQLWEQLLAGSGANDPGRAGLEAALAKAKHDQLELENALRARAGLAPLGPEAFEQQRRQEASVAMAHAHAGCLGSALALLGVLLVSLLALLALPTAQVHADEQETVIGTSQGGEPLTVDHLGDGATRFFIIGGQHGGPEANTVQLVTELQAYFEAHPEEIPANVTLDFLPVANPDGLKRGVRQFNSGVDPNRNWGGSDWAPDGYDSNGRFVPGLGGPEPFSEPETQALANYVLQTRPAFLINYHSVGGFIFGPRSGPGGDLAAAFADATGYNVPQPGGPSPLSYHATGSMNVWLGQSGIPALLVELASVHDPEFARNLAGVQAVLAGLAA